MSEILLGVIIGGLIASIAPIINMSLEHRRWKRQAKLEYLKQERQRFNDLYTKTYEKLSRAISENKYSVDLATTVDILMSKEISEYFWGFIRAEKKNAKAGQLALFNITSMMKKHIAQFDDEIRKLIE